MLQEAKVSLPTTSSKIIVMAGWDDAPHLEDDQKVELLASCEPHLRDSRSKGIPNLGSGAVFPIPVEEILVEPFEIKPWFYRAYGLDVGWNFTAAVWMAWDKDTDTIFLYDCYKREKAEPEIHSAAIRRRDSKTTRWPGVIDPAARGRGQADGQQILQMYRREGLKVISADNAVEAGIYSVWSRLSTGRLKIVRGPMSAWIDEYRMYRRDVAGKIIKTHDHLMDATRYVIQSGPKYAIRMNAQKPMHTESRNYGV